MSDLNEKALKDLSVELQVRACQNFIGLRPSVMYVHPEHIQAVAVKLNITYDEAFAHIKAICIGEVDAA